MDKFFEILFLDEAFEFLKNLDRKHSEKILYNIRKSQLEHNPELFKKLSDDIWEFRTLFNKTHYRLFAFWDNSEKTDTIVISTHGMIKKTDKTPHGDLGKAEALRKRYFEFKDMKK